MSGDPVAVLLNGPDIQLSISGVPASEIRKYCRFRGLQGGRHLDRISDVTVAVSELLSAEVMSPNTAWVTEPIDTPIPAFGYQIQLRGSQVKGGQLFLTLAVPGGSSFLYTLDVAFSAACAMSGVLVLHCAGVRMPSGRSLCLVGPSHSGKSTMCAAVLRCGGTILSDDLCALYIKAGNAHLASLRSVMSIREGAVEIFSNRHHKKMRRYMSGGEVRFELDLDQVDGRTASLCPEQTWLLSEYVKGTCKHGDSRKVSHADAMIEMMSQSSPLLFDNLMYPSISAAILPTVNKLLSQAPSWRLAAGAGLICDPCAYLSDLERRCS